MKSFRRNIAALQKDGSVNQFQENVDNSPSPKIYYSKTFLTLRGLLAKFPVSLDLLPIRRTKSCSTGNLAQRHQRSKGFKWKRTLFNLFIFFILGAFVGFTPFFSVNMPEFNVLTPGREQNGNKNNEIVDVDSHILSKTSLPEPEIVVKEEHRLLEEDEATKDLQKKEIVVNVEPRLLEEDETTDDLPKKEIGLKEEPKLSEADETTNDLQKMEIAVKEESRLPGELKKEELHKIKGMELRKLLIVVTTTHVRPFQAYYLNRLAHTLSVVPKPLLWIVVDRYYQSMETARILMATGLMYRHFSCMMNVTNMRKMINCQRNIAIYYIKKHHINGIVYFAEDDGIYSVELFEEMQKIKRFGTWPVATFQDSNKKLLLEGPLCNGKRVIGWHSNNQNTKAVRRFHTSLSGFAFNSTIIWDSKKWRRHPRSIIFHSTGKGSMQDSKFVELLIEDERQMEGLGDNCTKIMVWRNGLEAPQLDYPLGWSFQNNLQAIIPVL